MELDEKRELEELPEWVPMYLDCWGSKKPDGGRMTVSFAADFAGTTPDAVRMLRKRSAAFRRMEKLARHGTALWAQSYVEAGLRNRLPKIFASVDKLLDAMNVETTLTLLKMVRGKPEELRVIGELGVAADVWDLRGKSDEELARLLANLEAAEASASGTPGPRRERDERALKG